MNKHRDLFNSNQIILKILPKFQFNTLVNQQYYESQYRLGLEGASNYVDLGSIKR